MANEVANVETKFLINSNADLAEELDGVEVQPLKLKVPSSGGTAFEVPINPDDPEVRKELRVIITKHKFWRSYYAGAYNGENNPPDCYCDNTRGEAQRKIENDDPDADLEYEPCSCEDCEFAEFSGGCKILKKLSMILDGVSQPVEMFVPQMSVKNINTYISTLVAKGLRTKDVITKIRIKKAKSRTGIEYGQLVFEMDRPLTDAEREAAAQWIE